MQPALNNQISLSFFDTLAERQRTNGPLAVQLPGDCYGDPRVSAWRPSSGLPVISLRYQCGIAPSEDLLVLPDTLATVVVQFQFDQQGLLKRISEVPSLVHPHTSTIEFRNSQDTRLRELWPSLSGVPRPPNLQTLLQAIGGTS
jgi:hypothetical protein